MAESERFQRLVGRLPIGQDRLLALGLKFFLENQEPDEVNFTIHNNGWSIDVKTDDEHTDEALDFWEEYVEGKL